MFLTHLRHRRAQTKPGLKSRSDISQSQLEQYEFALAYLDAKVSSSDWAQQIAAATSKKRRTSKRPVQRPGGVAEASEDNGKVNQDDHDREGDDRPEYYCTQRTVLSVSAAKFDSANGEAALTMMLGTVTGSVEAVVVTVRDARLLTAGLLTSLATNDDEFAKRVLDEHFPFDADGNFRWPSSEDMR